MENRDIRIAFFDIDGTLLPPDHHLPESTVAALNILRAKGVQLYLATGRPPYHLHYLKKDLPFEFDGMVMMNGCNLVRRTEKGRLRRRGWGLRWEKAQKGGKGTNLRGFFED